MQCRHCGFGNGDDDHRCLRCGRRLKGVAIAAPPGYAGANALALSPASTLDETLDTTAEFLVARAQAIQTQTGAPAQPTLFTHPPANVIPFDELVRQNTGRTGMPSGRIVRTDPQQKPAPARQTVRKAAKPPVEQTTLDFIPAAPAVNRKLKTEVDAQIFCDLPVATPAHRAVAAAIDAAMILIGFGILTVAFQLLGGRFGAGKFLYIELSGVFALVALFYGLMWAIAGSETAGMRITDLQLITFDGFAVDSRSRALRFLSTWLSFCSAGLGVLWAVADEENLTWHDHISRTFPTIREEPRAFVKQRR